MYEISIRIYFNLASSNTALLYKFIILNVLIVRNELCIEVHESIFNCIQPMVCLYESITSP